MEANAAKGVHETVKGIIPKKKFKRYFDIGCGRGALLKSLSKRYEQGFGTDIEDHGIACKDKRIVFQKADLNREMPFGQERFDLITCVEVIEHIENQFSLVKNISSRLQKGGYAVISSPNIYNGLSKMMFLFSNRFIHFLDRDVYDHINPLVRNIFLDMLKKNRLKVVKTEFSPCHVPLLNCYLPLRGRFFGNVEVNLVKKV